MNAMVVAVSKEDDLEDDIVWVHVCVCACVSWWSSV